MSIKLETIDPQIVAEGLAALAAVLLEDEYTAYGVHRVLNKVLAANGVKGVKPQMMYNYLRNGLIVPGEKIFGETLRTVTKEEAAAFILRYVLKHGLKITVDETPAAPENTEPTGAVESEATDVVAEDDLEYVTQ
jgi:hypothetical protein